MPDSSHSGKNAEPKVKMSIVAHLNAQRDEIERRLQAAIDAGGDREKIEHLFGLLETAWSGLVIVNPDMMQILGIGFFRGFHPGDPEPYVAQAKSLLEIAGLDSSAMEDMVGLLEEYLNRFLAMRQQYPAAANHFARAVFLLSPDTVEMDIE